MRPSGISAVAVFLAVLALACTGGEDMVVSPPPDATPAPTEGTPATEQPSAPATDSSPTDAATPTLDGVETFEDLSQDHVEGLVDYEQTPPVGGPHAGEWLNCGFYSEPVPAENAVHSLEHGAVWITYDASVDPTALRELTENEYVLVTPFEGLPSPVVASAWGAQLSVDGPDDPRLQQFVETYAGGPRTPEPGAPCNGGIGEPEPPAVSV